MYASSPFEPRRARRARSKAAVPTPAAPLWDEMDTVRSGAASVGTDELSLGVEAATSSEWVTSSVMEPSSVADGRLSGGSPFDTRVVSDISPPTPKMRVRVDRLPTSADAGEGARFCRARQYAHAIAVQRTHPRPTAATPTVVAVESEPEALTASPAAAETVGEGV